MIPEREREALMRLTMCARGECAMCKYEKTCTISFQYELATENMNILADALRVANAPQTEEICERCVYVRGSQWCQGCNGTPKRWDGEKIVDTPQTDCSWGEPKDE